MIYIKTTDAVSTLRNMGIILSRNELAKAEYRAINRSLARARTAVRKEVTKVYNIPYRYTKGIKVNQAHENQPNPRGELGASTKPLPLDAFSPKQQKGNQSITITRRGEHRIKHLKRVRKTPDGGVFIEIERGKVEQIPYAFLLPGGKARVFARGEYKHGTEHGFVVRNHRVNSTGNDIPIKPLITMSIYGEVINKKVLEPVVRDIKTFYPGRLVHEINVIAKKLLNS